VVRKIFYVEPHDEKKVLVNPQEYVSVLGGYIFFAKYNKW
jgi:hypothetical protein